MRTPRVEITSELVQRRFSRYSPYSANGLYTESIVSTNVSEGDIQHVMRMSHAVGVARSFCMAAFAITQHALEIAEKRLDDTVMEGEKTRVALIGELAKQARIEHC